MADVRGLIIKSGYVINTIIIKDSFVDEFRAELMAQGKELFIDEDGWVGIGDKWMENYGGFFRPIGFLPNDVPEELVPPVVEGGE